MRMKTGSFSLLGVALLIASLTLAGSIHAAEDTPGAAASEPAAADAAAEDADEESPAAAPSAETLKERKLGDAFRRFQPSEEISADNAVPFPVDI